MRTIAKAIAFVVALVLVFGVIGCRRTVETARRSDTSSAAEASSTSASKTDKTSAETRAETIDRGPVEVDTKRTVRIDPAPGKPGRTITTQRTVRRGPVKRTSGTSTAAHEVGEAEAANASRANGSTHKADKSATDTRVLSPGALALLVFGGIAALVALAYAVVRWGWPALRKAISGGVL